MNETHEFYNVSLSADAGVSPGTGDPDQPLSDDELRYLRVVYQPLQWTPDEWKRLNVRNATRLLVTLNIVRAERDALLERINRARAILNAPSRWTPKAGSTLGQIELMWRYAMIDALSALNGEPERGEGDA